MAAASAQTSLVVDDEAQIRRALSDASRQLDIAVLEALTGASTFDIVGASRLDLVVPERQTALRGLHLGERPALGSSVLPAS